MKHGIKVLALNGCGNNWNILNLIGPGLRPLQLQQLFDAMKENTTFCSTLEELGLSGNKFEEIGSSSFKEFVVVQALPCLRKLNGLLLFDYFSDYS